MATAKLQAVVTTKGVNKANSELNKFTKSANDAESQTKKTGKSVSGLKAPFLSAVSFVGKAAAAATAFAAAGIAVVVSASKANREIEILARQARTTASDFQATAFATGQFGITAEQFADISKDVADKVGEFATAGTGAFQDYADVLGLTKEEAIKTATEFQGLSSSEVIGRVVSGLESVNATSNKTTFALESLGNDLSRLAPLYANNSAELKKLEDRYKNVNSQLALTSGQSKALDEVAASGTLLASSLGNAGKLISSAVAPILDSFFNSVISIVPKATQVIVDFINTFKDIENINSIKSLTLQTNLAIGEVSKLRDVYIQVEKNITTLQSQGIVGESIIQQERDRLNAVRSEIEAQNKIIDSLQKRKKAIEDENKISSPPSISGGKIGGVNGDIPTGDNKEKLKAEIENIISLNDTALQKIDSSESERKAKVKQALSQGLIDKITALDAEIAAEVNAEAQRMEIRQRSEDQRIRNKEAAQQQLEQFIQLNNTELEEVDRVESERLAKLRGYKDEKLIIDSEYQLAKKEIELAAEMEREELRQVNFDKQKARYEEENALAIQLGKTFSKDVSGGLVDAALAGESMSDVLLTGIRDVAAGVIKASLETFIQQKIVDKLMTGFFVASKVAETTATTAQAAQNAFAATAAIPIVGPALAPAAAAAAGATAASLGAAVISAASAREQGGMLASGQTSTVAERGLEILTPANASRVRTANDMKNIMGESNSSPNVNIVVIDQSEGGKEYDQSTDDEGRIVLLIRNTVSGDLSQSNSQISKSLSGNTTAQRRRA